MMSKKRLVGLVVMFVLLSSPTFAANESSCSGFWGSLSCFLWGDSSNRAGMGWFEGRGNVVGESYTQTVTQFGRTYTIGSNDQLIYNGNPVPMKIVRKENNEVSFVPMEGYSFIENDELHIVEDKTGKVYDYGGGIFSGLKYNSEKGLFITEEFRPKTPGSLIAVPKESTDLYVPEGSSKFTKNKKTYWVTPDGIVYDADGKKINGLKYFKEDNDIKVVKISAPSSPKTPNPPKEKSSTDASTNEPKEIKIKGATQVGEYQVKDTQVYDKFGNVIDYGGFTVNGKQYIRVGLTNYIDKDGNLYVLSYTDVEKELGTKNEWNDITHLANPDKDKLNAYKWDFKDSKSVLQSGYVERKNDERQPDVGIKLTDLKTEAKIIVGDSFKNQIDMITGSEIKEGAIIYYFPGGMIKIREASLAKEVKSGGKIDYEDIGTGQVIEQNAAGKIIPAELIYTVPGKTDIDSSKSKDILILNGNVVAEQSKVQQSNGEITVTGKTVFIGKEKELWKLSDDLSKEGGSGIIYYKDADAKGKGEALGSVKVEKDTYSTINFNDETQTIVNTKTGQKQELKGDYYKNGKSDCKDQNGCFFATGGTITEFDNEGKVKSITLADYDYKGFGGDKKLEDVQLFDPKTGRYVGSYQNVPGYGDVMFRQEGGKMTLQFDGKTSPDFYKGDDGIWKTASGQNMDTWAANVKNPPVQLTKEEQGTLERRGGVERQVSILKSLLNEEPLTSQNSHPDFSGWTKNGVSDINYYKVDGFSDNIIKIVYTEKGKDYVTFYNKEKRTFQAPNDQFGYNFNAPETTTRKEGSKGYENTHTDFAQKSELDKGVLSTFLEARNINVISSMSEYDKELIVKAMGYGSLEDYKTKNNVKNNLDEVLLADAKKQQELAEKQKVAEREVQPSTVQDMAKKSYESTTLQSAQTTIDSIYAISSSFKSYPALSKLLYGETKGYKDWQNAVDRSFAPMLGSNWFPSTICEGHYDIEPQGKVMIKTASGTYQAVASIQMEKSQDKSPILCQKNPDEQAEKKWICDQKQVCVKDQFCYDDQNEDGEQDSDKPLEGYFYKITWAVSAPRDEVQTPYVNEDGVAVSFNIYVDQNANDAVDSDAKAIYNLKGNTKGPIQLQNGASDKQVIIKYSPKEYREACIGWNQAPTTTPRYAGTPYASSTTFGAHAETGIRPQEIRAVCFSAVTSSVGQVNWQRSGQSGGTTTASEGKVTQNGGW